MTEYSKLSFDIWLFFFRWINNLGATHFDFNLLLLINPLQAGNIKPESGEY